MSRKKKRPKRRLEPRRTGTIAVPVASAPGMYVPDIFDGRTSSIQISAATFSGPLPPPEMLERYAGVDGVLPRILDATDREQSHRHELERQDAKRADLAVRGQVVSAFSGQVFAFLIAIGGLSAAAYCAYKGYGGTAALIGPGGIVPIVLGFLRRRQLTKTDAPASPPGA